jgi:hypothetical protein
LPHKQVRVSLRDTLLYVFLYPVKLFLIFLFTIWRNFVRWKTNGRRPFTWSCQWTTRKLDNLACHGALSTSLVPVSTVEHMFSLYCVKMFHYILVRDRAWIF